MKSKVNVYIPKPEDRELEFPVWARNKNGAIVLFNSLTKGTVIKQGINTNFDKQGIHHEYIKCTDVDIWEILPEGTKITITLGESND